MEQRGYSSKIGYRNVLKIRNRQIKWKKISDIFKLKKINDEKNILVQATVMFHDLAKVFVVCLCHLTKNLLALSHVVERF